MMFRSLSATSRRSSSCVVGRHALLLRGTRINQLYPVASHVITSRRQLLSDSSENSSNARLFCQLRSTNNQKRMYSSAATKKDSKQRVSVRAKEVKQKTQQKDDSVVHIEGQKIRNVGIIAHIDAGKTTTTERMLFYSGYSQHLGTVDDGDTITDYMPQEQDRGITITSAAITFPWNDHKINLIDTPGHVDFTVEVERCVRVLDGAVAVFDAVTGVEAQTKTVWKQAKRYGVPRIAFMNKMDKIGADFDAAMQTIKEKLDIDPIAIQFPVGEADGFRAIVDLVTMQVLTFSSHDKGSTVTCVDLDASNLTDDVKEDAREARSRMIEEIADHDETFADLYLELDEEGVTAADIKAAIRRFTLKGDAVAVLCGTSLRNMGVQPLMDAIIDYLPNPMEREAPLATWKSNSEEQFPVVHDPQGPLCALAFKVLNDAHLGPLVFVRVYSGEIGLKTELYNATTGMMEQPTKVFQMHANIPQDVPCITAGNIGVIVGTKNTRTGDTLLASRDRVNPYELEKINIPQPVFFCSIEPESSAMQGVLDKALEDLQREDPSFIVTVDPETTQTLISGMGELHLEIIKDRLEKDFKVPFYTGPVMISYKETLSLDRPMIHKCEYEKSKGEVYHLILQVSSNTRGKGNKFRMALDQGMCEPIIDAIHPLRTGVEEGVKNALMRGALLGFSMEDLEIRMLGASLPPQFSHKRFIQQNLNTMKIVAEKCLREVFARCGEANNISLLEPIMSLDIQVDTQYLGSVLSDISGGRRGKVRGISVARGVHDEQVVHAEVPLSELIGYAKHLRSMTRGLGHYVMQFEKYEVMSKEYQAKKLVEIRGY